MAIYLVYFSLILIVPALCSNFYKNKEKAQTVALKILVFLVYLILALKGNNVGNDIQNYKEWFEITKTYPFNDFSYCYMENGYILLMKIFSFSGFSFQTFTAIIYLIILIPLYFFIKKYSSDIMLSMMIWFCLDYFAFSCSGIRQAAAMSICLFSYMLLTQNKSVKYFLLSVVILLIAASIHKSALLFSPVLIVTYSRNRFFTYTAFLIASIILLINPHILIDLNQEYEMTKYGYDKNLTIGLMFVFEVIMFVFYLISIKINKTRVGDKGLLWELAVILIYGLILSVALSGAILMRVVSYELIFLIVVMPRAINSWEKNTRMIIKTVYVMVLFYCLYYLDLVPKTLNIVPYHFFFE